MMNAPTRYTMNEIEIFTIDYKCNANDLCLLRETIEKIQSGKNIKAIVINIIGSAKVFKATKEEAIDLEFFRNVSIPLFSIMSYSCSRIVVDLARACTFRLATPNVQISLGDDYVLTGLEAMRIGIIDQLVEGENSIDHGVEFVNKLIKNRTRDLIELIVRAIKNPFVNISKDAYSHETELFCVAASKAFM